MLHLTSTVNYDPKTDTILPSNCVGFYVQYTFTVPDRHVVLDVVQNCTRTSKRHKAKAFGVWSRLSHNRPAFTPASPAPEIPAKVAEEGLRLIRESLTFNPSAKDSR